MWLYFESRYFASHVANGHRGARPISNAPAGRSCAEVWSKLRWIFFVFRLFPMNFVLLFRDFFGWPSGVGSPWAGWLLSGLGGSRAALAGPGAALCDMREVLGCFPGGRALG